MGWELAKRAAAERELKLELRELSPTAIWPMDRMRFSVETRPGARQAV